MMRNLILIICLSIAGLQSFSQSTTHESVKIFVDPRVDQYLIKYNNTQRVQAPQFVYRIQLISSYTRGDASSTQARFRNLYPNEFSRMRHDGVKYLVTAFEFPSKAEAEVMLREIRRNFPSSFLLPPERLN